MKPTSRAYSLENEKAFRWISYTLVFLLMGCTTLILSILIYTVFPEWHSAIIAGVTEISRNSTVKALL